jgi:integrase
MSNENFHTRKGTRYYRKVYTWRGHKRICEDFTLKIKADGRQVYFNMGPNKKEAGKLADEIKAFLAVRGNTIGDAIRRYGNSNKIVRLGASGPLTVGKLIEAYRQQAGHLSQKTVTVNILALRRIATFISGTPINPAKTKKKNRLATQAKVDELCLDRITAQRVEEFRNAFIKAAGADEESRAQATTSANTYIRAARSMFSSKMVDLLKDLGLPSPSPFHGIKALPERPHRYISRINPTELYAAARRELQDSQPAVFIVIMLCLHCGMRRNEIDKLIWDQVDFENRHIWIRTTPHFRPKARNSNNQIDANPEVFAHLRAFQRLSITPPFVLPGTGPGLTRCEPLFDQAIEWLRKHGVTETKALHSLRKEAGSLVFHNTGSVDRAADFLRNHPSVAREHYIGRKDRLEVVLP